jgi:hypothetical protein
MTPSELSDRRKRALQMPRYLVELSRLTGRQVQVEELGSIEQAAALRQIARSRGPLPEAKYELEFSALRTEKFRTFVAALVDANPAPIYIWTQDTIHCGALLLASLAQINFDFDTDLTESGVVVFSTQDHEDRLLLDWTIDEQPTTPLQMEVAGAHWSSVRF